MPFRAFQVLLAAGYRLRMREQMLAINAAAFPHTSDRDRKRAIAELQKQVETEPEEDAGTTGGDVNKLRMWARMEAMQHPRVVRRPAKPPDAATEAESDPDEVG